MGSEPLSPLEQYRRLMEEIEDLQRRGQAWFAERLAKSRSGDEQAHRELAGACLRHVFSLALEYGVRFNDEERMDAVQVANNGLMRAIKSYQGHDAGGFLEHVSRVVKTFLALTLKRRP